MQVSDSRFQVLGGIGSGLRAQSAGNDEVLPACRQAGSDDEMKRNSNINSRPNSKYPKYSKYSKYSTLPEGCRVKKLEARCSKLEGVPGEEARCLKRDARSLKWYWFQVPNYLFVDPRHAGTSATAPASFIYHRSAVIFLIFCKKAGDGA